MAFKIAGSMAFKEAARRAESGHPRADHERGGGDCPAEYMGDITRRPVARRGKIGGMIAAR
jgi:hypothetical protein